MAGRYALRVPALDLEKSLKEKFVRIDVDRIAMRFDPTPANPKRWDGIRGIPGFGFSKRFAQLVTDLLEIWLWHARRAISRRNQRTSNILLTL